MKVVDTNACEFGYELIMVLPYVYYLNKNNIPVKVLTSKGMREFYYFLSSEQYVEKYDVRTDRHPLNTRLKSIHFPTLDTTEWEFPNYIDRYKDVKLDVGNEKPLLIISNKFTREWFNDPVNFLDVNTLDILLSKLKERYTVIYNRPLPTMIVEDSQTSYKLGDYELIKEEHPEVLDMNNIAIQNQIPFNILQLILGSKCEKFISVQGGNSILSSIFGGTNLIYAIKGGELLNNSFSWYNKFSGTNIKHFTAYKDLIKYTFKVY